MLCFRWCKFPSRDGVLLVHSIDWGQSRDLNAEAFTGRQDSWSGKFMIVDGIGADLSVQRHRCGTVVWGPWHECQCVGGNISEASGKHAGTCIRRVCSYEVVNTILWYILYVDVHLELLLDCISYALMAYCICGWQWNFCYYCIAEEIWVGIVEVWFVDYCQIWVAVVGHLLECVLYFFFHLHKRISICCKYGDA